MISIRDILNRYAATLDKKWDHDRSRTVGASEIGQCARKIHFAKHNAPRDPDYSDGWGARLRGSIIEEQFWVPALRATLPEDVQLLFAYPEQKTLVSGYLSATTDGLLVWPNGYCVNLDCKSEDPRNMRQGVKPEHKFQVQTQMGLLRDRTEYKPDESVVTYIDASHWDKVDEARVQFDPRIYANAHLRAERIITERDPLALPPEGKMASGGECRFCAWASHCADVAIAGVPKARQPLGDNSVAQLKSMRDEALAHAEAAEKCDAQAASIREQIKQFLRDHDSRGHKGEGWSVSYSVSKGRETLDLEAIDKAGIDLSPYRKPGSSSERLTIR